MKVLNTVLYCALAVGLLSFASCSEDDDTNAPTISNYTVNGVDELVLVEVLAGASLDVNADISEDIEMASFRIQVDADFTTTTATPFSFDQEYSASGLSATVDETITVPASAVGGPYKVTLTATDAADRLSDREIDVAVSSPTQAEITLTTPDPATISTIAFGDTIFLVGMATDETDLTSLGFIVEPIQMEGGLSASGGPFYDETVMLSGSSDTSYDLSELATSKGFIVVPSGITTGQYALKIRAIDSHENVAVESVTFNIF